MNKQKLVVATGNADKIREFTEILDAESYEIISMQKAGIYTEVEENGSTFEENARIKASAIADKTDAIVVADDSGLVIDALGGEPGIYSSRYLGEDTPYSVKNQIILERLLDVPREERSARFICAIVAILPDGREISVQGTIEGYIGYEPMGENGFGYDPIFYVEEYNASTASLTPEQKNAISHRGKALRALRDRLSL